MPPKPMPAAEVDVTADLVRRLLAGQHPDLAGLPVAPFANGWDNAIFRLGGNLAVRLPRREAAARLVAHEQRWLPVLAGRLPLPVPAPVRLGSPDRDYPWPWSVVPLLPGEAACDRPPADLPGAAVQLAGFLAALHAPAPPDAPANPSRGVPLASRAVAFAANLDLVAEPFDRAAAARVWESALAAPGWDGPPLWLHGDLHPANILVHRGQVSGVIDFGDITAGDPATDLAVAWLLLPPPCHGAFRAAYRRAAGHPAGEGLWARARGWALALSIVLLAHSADNPQLAGIGRRALRTVLAA